MKRLWIGVVLLIVICAGGIGMLFFSTHFHRQFCETLAEAKTYALAENWDTAAQRAKKADELWHRHRHFLASFTDHEPIEEIELMLSRLTLYESQRQTVDFADICQSLCLVSEAIEESHHLKWWSVL